MNTKKKIIIILTASLTIIGGSSYLIWNYYQTKDDQEKVENEASSKQQKENNSEIENPENNKTSPDGETEQQPANNSPDVENPEKKEENIKPQENNDQQLVSYFSVFIISWIIVILAYFIILQKKIKAESEIGPYLVFIKMVCEIVAYENCMVDKTKDLKVESDKYNSYLQLDLVNLKKFLDAFLFQPQTGKDKVRQQAHQIIFNFRNRFSKGLLEFFLFFLFGYLFIIIVNLIINIFFHGFNKTCSRLKINYLWTFIQRMNKLYKKIIAYLFLSCPFLIALINYILNVKDPSFVLEKQDSAIGNYWLLENFCNARENSIYFSLLRLFKDELFSQNFYKLVFKDDDNKDIIHHNLDSTKVVFDKNIITLEEYKKSFLKEGKMLFNNIEKYFDKNNDFEKEILEKLQSFMNVNPF